MFLVVGLGNPGRQYQDTRHNIGFRVVEVLAGRGSACSWRTDRDAEVARTSIASEEVILVKPTTFMNRSGEAVSRIARFFKVPNGRVIIVHDELDIPFGAFRVKVGGGDAGHNGLRSVTQQLGGSGYCRVRVGIGRPPIVQMAVADWVLGAFSSRESAVLEEVISGAADVVEEVIANGMQRAQQLASRRSVKRPPEEGSGGGTQ